MIVLDTSVLVSGLLNPAGVPGRIVGLVASGILRLSYDARILSEYAEVLSPAEFGFDPRNVETLLQHIAATGLRVTPDPLLLALPDRGDEPFLEVAIKARRPLVTGNVKHYPVPLRCGVDAFNYPQLLAKLNPRWMSVSRAMPRQRTMLPGGGSRVRSR